MVCAVYVGWFAEISLISVVVLTRCILVELIANVDWFALKTVATMSMVVGIQKFHRALKTRAVSSKNETLMLSMPRNAKQMKTAPTQNLAGTVFDMFVPTKHHVQMTANALTDKNAGQKLYVWKRVYNP